MNSEPTKTKPPTCRELQAQIDAQLEQIRVLSKNIEQLYNDKLDAEASRMITADVKSALSTATKYYEQAHAVFNDTLSASKQAAKTAQYLTNFERVLANYYKLPWYKRIFRAPKTPRATEEKN